ncbi:VWA domain-containing protein [Sulfurimonas sp.]|uniref:vWA domain-containing protein n=1 Tax=Sulfurimonas sp. TaxID=2022749 RepID=UPI0025E3EAD5|nr:VWA domain-containing protein [Sulfurimonas sp.]MDD5158205.1 VWA domain-containing protein [Sulfurimonas sp.]
MRLSSIYFPHTAQFLKKSLSSSKLMLFLKWFGIVMLIFTLMSPVKEEPYTLEPKDGHEIALILDTSESMSAMGFDIANIEFTRFDVVKEIVSDFIKERKNDNIGLVVFGEFSFIASPLTYDENILNKIVSQLYIGIAGKYTALNTAIAQGVDLLKMGKSKSKVAILLTDGYSTEGIDKIPLDISIEMAKKERVKIYPIGIGAPNEYNAEVLKRVAKESGGVAFGATNAGELREIYKKIDEIEKSKIKNRESKYLTYYYQLPLFLSFISLMLYIFLRNKRGYA